MKRLSSRDVIGHVYLEISLGAAGRVANRRLSIALAGVGALRQLCTHRSSRATVEVAGFCNRIDRVPRG